MRSPDSPRLPWSALLMSIALLGSTADAALAQTLSVTASGQGSAAIYRMEGGTVQIGWTEAEVRQMMNATGKQQAELLRKFVADLNRQTERAAFTEGAVVQFLGTLTRRQVPPGEWQQALGEITRRYLELEARMAAIPVTSDRIKSLVDRAEAARMAGRFDEADSLLGEAALAAIDDARRLKDQARSASRQAASVLASQASLALTRFDRAKGARLLVKAFEQRAGDVDSATFWWLIEAGDAALADGRGDRRSAWALQTYQRAQIAAQSQLLADPGNAEWQRDLSISHNKIGDVQVAQGDREGALRSFQAGMTIRRQLAERDPGNAQWQRDLSISHERIGDVQVAQGDREGALRSFQAGMTMARQLAERDPGNAQWQTDMAVFCWKIGSLDTPALLKAQRRATLEHGLGTLKMLDRAGRLEPRRKGWIGMFEQAIRTLD